LLNSDFDHFEQLAEPATRRTPCLEAAGEPGLDIWPLDIRRLSPQPQIQRGKKPGALRKTLYHSLAP
jgi:hypothetical protein